MTQREGSRKKLSRLNKRNTTTTIFYFENTKKNSSLINEFMYIFMCLSARIEIIVFGSFF
jgi:hypothetical protein